MNHRPGNPVPEQEAAFEHDDVREIVDTILAKPVLALVKLAAKAIYFPDIGADFDAIYAMVGSGLYWDDELGPAAIRIAQAGVRISTEADFSNRVRRRGAVLERLVHALVARRAPAQTYREHKVELMSSPRCKRSWSRPKEVLVDGRPFEIYECKANALPDPGDADELSDIATTARLEGTGARPSVIVFGSMESLRQKARVWHLDETLYGVDTEHLLDLQVRAPTSGQTLPLK